MLGLKGYFYRWLELLAIFMLLVGYIIGGNVNNNLSAIVISIIAGVLMGGFVYTEHEDHFVPALFVSAGFIVGYIMGNKVSSDLLLMSAFTVSLAVTYYIYLEGYLDKLR